jgi:hypothetical protein
VSPLPDGCAALTGPIPARTHARLVLEEKTGDPYPLGLKLLATALLGAAVELSVNPLEASRQVAVAAHQLPTFHLEPLGGNRFWIRHDTPFPDNI